MVAVVDTNCDPTVVDYVIPGNDDALRAIRLFTSKIADSAAEGVNLVGDKAFAGRGCPRCCGMKPLAEEAAPAEEVDLEAALGGGIRKAPAAVAARWKRPKPPRALFNLPARTPVRKPETSVAARISVPRFSFAGKHVPALGFGL